jgi:putative membrane protein
MKPYHYFLLVSFLVIWVWAAINPLFPHDWLLENYLVFISVPLILLSARYFKLSDTSYGLITLFMILHVIGSHYTYAEVPFGDTLQVWFDAERNMYDRLVHFCFGLLLAYPIHEVFLKVAKARGFWSYFLPLDLTMSFSALYEVIEWITARNVDPAAGLAFLGSQGDVWDAQKDMGLAGLGALLAMFVVACVHAYTKDNFWAEIRESVRPIKE